jgi:starvation-inducible DNA-binding protein
MSKAATSIVRTYKSSVGVLDANRQAIIALLNARLADSVDLHSQVKWAHWNVKGMHFIQLHELFDSVAEHVEEQTDSIAERVVALGGVANGTTREAAARSGLKEAAVTAVKEAGDLGDDITVDLFTEITRKLDKDLWFLEAHLQA